MPESEPDYIDPFDDCEWIPARELFRRLGFEPLAPPAVDDFQLRGRLWELIYAMAGRRFYLNSTNHLDDRALYAWIHDEWLAESVADIPPEAKWNCHVDASDFETGKDPTKWLRYYATEEERLQWALEFHDLLPPHEDPPCDRDRWLPEPPGLPAEVGDEDLFPSDEDVEFEPDPLGLERVDAEIAAEKRSEELAAIPGGERPEDWERPIDQLEHTGVLLLPPDELTDETLAAKLWELLHNLACGGFYVLHTDHLSDRQLYFELWQRGLRDEALLPGKIQTSGWYHDFVGSGSEEDIQMSLRYYDTEDERAEHLRQWPEEPLPPKEQPPYNRDWRLPKGPI